MICRFEHLTASPTLSFEAHTTVRAWTSTWRLFSPSSSSGGSLQS